MTITEKLETIGMIKEVSTKTLASGDKSTKMVFEFEGAEVLPASMFSQLQAGARCKIVYDPALQGE